MQIIIELFNELFYEYSLICFWFGRILSMVPLIRLGVSFHRKSDSTNLFIRQSGNIQIQLRLLEQVVSVISEITNWIIRKTNRAGHDDDDDTDSNSFSLTNKNKKRGGKRWKNNLYSHFLKRIFSRQHYYFLPAVPQPNQYMPIPAVFSINILYILFPYSFKGLPDY